MALIQCAECNQMVSDKAAICPHCGCPMTMVDEQIYKKDSIISIILNILGLIVIGLGCTSMILGLSPFHTILLFIVGGILLGIAKIVK